MSKDESTSSRATVAGWYDLFSRGARDWLRHNEKVREAVRSHLPEAIAGGDVLSGGTKTIRVPVRMLEHYHFRLRTRGRTAGRRPGRGQARRHPRPAGRHTRIRQGRRRPQRRRLRISSRIQGRRHRRLAVGRDEIAEFARPCRPRRRGRLDPRRLGSSRCAFAPGSQAFHARIHQAPRSAIRRFAAIHGR